MPFAHSFREMGATLPWVRDTVDRLYYRIPEAFILEAEHQRMQLRRWTNAPVSILPYVVTLATADTPSPPPSPRDGVLHVGVIGRVYFRHKNQDIVPQVAAALRAQGRAVVFHIIGDGPDLQRLRDLVVRAGVSDDFQFHGWLERGTLHDFVRHHLDLVLIPSHFEGVPLVFLEAIALGRPVIVSDLPYVRDYPVPREWLVDPRSSTDISKKIAAAGEGVDFTLTAALRAYVVAKHSRAAFEACVVQTFKSLGAS